MKRHLALVWLLLGLALMLIPLAVFLKTSASESTLNTVAPGLARLGDRATVHAQGRIAPLINLADGREVLTTYAGDAEAQRLLQQNLVQPLAIASSDFDEDGVEDLISGYAAPGGGVITLHRGNADVIYPNAPEAQQHKTSGTFTDAPFLSPALAFKTPRPVDFIGCGDFDADGHYDIVTAARGGSSLFFFLGDGRGNLSTARQVEVPGRVTAMVAGEMDRADGLTDIVVGIAGADGAKALVLEAPEGALGAIPETFSLSSEATSLVLGQFDNDSPMDLAVASGRELIIVRGQAQRLSINESKQARAREASIERRSFSFAISSLAVGDFTGRHHDDLAILAQNGTVHLLGRPDTVSPAKARKSAFLQRWLDEALPDSWPEARQLVRTHASSMPTDDLVVIDSRAHQLQLVARHAPAHEEQPSSVMRESLDVDGEPIAVLPMRLNADAQSDLVILRRNATSPSVVPTAPTMTFVVNTFGDASLGTLRQAIMDANASPGADMIVFAIGSGQQTINLLSPLPTITEAVTIDGTTQPGFVGSPLIELNGNAVPAGGSGLSITSGNCTVRALVINRFADNAGSGGGGIVIQTGGNNLLEGNFIGTDFGGAAALSNFIGVFIASSNVNTVGGLLTSSHNVISGNTAAGLFMVGSSTGNQIQGNFIGTNAAGTADLGNGLSGVQLEGIANNTIGGTIAGARNIISGNGDQGMLIRTSATANLVQGNFIGTDITGTIALGNNGSGVFVQDAPNNTIGGVAAGAGNLISGNLNNGIEIVTTTGTIVQGNLIGTNAPGTAAIANAANGMRVVLTTSNTIGGTAAGARNVISGNGNNGVILESGGDANTVQGNFIGTNAAGTAAIPNTFHGVAISSSANNTIGGTTPTARNIISGNIGGAGVFLLGTATGNQIQGNFIGTDVTGTAALANNLGVQFEGVANNTLGGTAAGARNVVSGNIGGVLIRLGSSGIIVQGNFIGTDVTGNSALGNNGNGVTIQDGTTNTIGGTAAGAGNVISGNGGDGLGVIAGSGNTAQGNFFGTNAAGTAALGNVDGVAIVGSASNTIGGTAAGAGNVMSGNGSIGLDIVGGSANTVHGNFIGTNSAGTAAVPNNQGLLISNSSGNTIGGSVAGARNIISGNTDFGLGIENPSSTGNLVLGNFIGTNSAGTAALANFQGIIIVDSPANTIGAPVAGAGNIISGNIDLGLLIANPGSTGNDVRGNFIGTDVTGTVALGNGAGVQITSAANNTIGGAAAGFGNLISSNANNGLGINGGSNNTVQGNFIGTSASGAAILGNAGNGIAIGSSTNNTIGGATAAARNLLSGNGVHGIVLATSADGNTIQGNFIGVNAAGNAAIANVGSGITIFDSSNVIITGNVISGNSDDGVHMDNTAPGGQNNRVRGNFIGTNPAGTVSIPNADNGVVIFNMPNNIIGGTTAAERNIISGNGSANPSSDGVEIGGNLATGTQVLGNFIGTDTTGTADLGNSGSGILINDAPNNTIGGTSAGSRNIISGNDQNGILITSSLAANNTVQGNFIGTDVNGTVDLGNSGSGVLINAAPNNIIGGTSAGARNIISGNNGNGALIFGSLATGNQVQSNFIGTDASGTSPLANSLSGVVLSTGASNNTIGGTSAGAGNTIAFNGAIGVDIAGGTGNAALSNSIFSNLGLGINLNDDGGVVTANDNCDGDSGANNVQNFPLLTTANSSPGNTTIIGTLNSTTATTFRIEFFSNAACDPSGNGEGQTFIGSTNVSTAGVCDVVINASFPVTVPAGSAITATATDPLNNTSEFSPCVTVAGVLVCTLTCPPDLIAFTPPAATACGTVVTYSPTSSGCGTVSCAPPSGSVFAVGATTVTCTAVGGPSCSFSITVVDATPPISTCPTGISTTLPKGQTSAVVNYPVATATDNCGAATVICTPPPGSTFPVGSTLISCRATDSSNNESLCFFFVTLFDGEVPVIVCPPNVNTSLPAGQTSAVVNFPPPTVTDNLPGVSVVCSPRSGSSFPAGTTTVICTATDATNNKSSCSFTVSVGGAQAKVTLPGGKPTIDFAANSSRKPPKPKNNPCTFFTIQNTGFAPLILTFDSLARTGSDVDSGRTTDPIDTRFFNLNLVNSDQSLTPFEMGAVLTLQPGQSQNICIRFSALIPALAGKTTGLSASDVLPDTLTSQLVFRQNGGANIIIPLVAKVPTGLVLVNLDNPRAPAEVIFTRSGNEITVSYAVFDPNLDVSRAKYEFLSGNGQVVAGPFDVDLSGPVRSLNLVKGQSFRVDQRFTGASSHPEITGVRLTVFDGETSVGNSSTASAPPISAARVQLMNPARRVTVYPPDVTFRPQLP